MEKKKTRKKSYTLRDFTLLVMFVAILAMMKLLGLGTIQIGPLNMSFLTLPVAIGAMLLGVWQGALLGLVVGLFSFWDAVSGASLMTGAFFALNPFSTFLLCVVTRMLMGLFTGLIFRLLSQADEGKTICYWGGALAAPLLNTLFFMGYILLFFFHTEYVQNLCEKLGQFHPILFAMALVGVQGIVEAVSCCLLGGSVAKGVAHALKLDRPATAEKKNQEEVQ